jgi:hypothetical protein
LDLLSTKRDRHAFVRIERGQEAMIHAPELSMHWLALVCICDETRMGAVIEQSVMRQCAVNEKDDLRHKKALLEASRSPLAVGGGVKERGSRALTPSPRKGGEGLLAH